MRILIYIVIKNTKKYTMYTFKATVNRVMPNGIVNLTFDLGFGMKHISNCLLHNVAILGDKEEKVGV